ncbi:hypothetical protein OX89_02565 [Diaphorobacter sp. J5-51]|nr:hypothetical protein OX89_02565 [Diaphorobacter sp. J5-51]
MAWIFRCGSGYLTLAFMNNGAAVCLPHICRFKCFHADGVSVHGQKLNLVGHSLSVNMNHDSDIAWLQTEVWQWLLEHDLCVFFEHSYLLAWVGSYQSHTNGTAVLLPYSRDYWRWYAATWGSQRPRHNVLGSEGGRNDTDHWAILGVLQQAVTQSFPIFLDKSIPTEMTELPPAIHRVK